MQPPFALTLDHAADIAQVVTAIIAFVGVIVTLRIAISTIREMRHDRVLRHRPYLAFNQGGYRYTVAFVEAGKRIPGVNPRYVEKLFPLLPDTALSVHLVDPPNSVVEVGHLTNYGVGPALHTEVTWVPHEIRIGDEKFKIDNAKLSEPCYCRELNTMPSYVAHISPGGNTFLTRLPTFIDKDTERKIKEVHGHLHISCLDIFHNRLTSCQEFSIFTYYRETPPKVHITFGNLITDKGITTQKLLQ
ncbi:MAG: hypothetical protein LV481_07070 [Methylacidiphilales bacterium]|nr:hypothetical protein [Candidatus Methylacidiphilales bacterium]